MKVIPAPTGTLEAQAVIRPAPSVHVIPAQAETSLIHQREVIGGATRHSHAGEYPVP